MNQAMTTDNITPFEGAPQGSGNTVGQTVGQFKELAETGLGSLKEFAANPEGFMSSEKGRELKELAESSFGDAKEKLKVLLKDGEIYARANPGKAVLAAVGVGFVLGVLLKR
jgi:ElaB/YqjD/DUF883 family membrane-anchored ribosome-binding protein